MNRKRMFWLNAFLAFLLVITPFLGSLPGQAAANWSKKAITQLSGSVTAYLEQTDEKDDWNAIVRHLAAYPANGNYIQQVKDSVYQEVYSDPSRLATAVIGWTAAGNDATDVDGVNLIEKLSALTIKQDLLQNSEFIWSLLALDSGNYAVPSGASLTREKLIDAILETQVAGGGWNTFHWMDGEWKYPDYTNYPAIDYCPLSQMTEADVDMTSMAIQALAPYRQTNPAVREAIQQALDRIDASKIDNANSLAQLITALCSLRIDPTDFRGRNLLEQLLAYALDGGMFKYNNTSWGSQPNALATRDAVIALFAYLKFVIHGVDQSIYYQINPVYDLFNLSPILRQLGLSANAYLALTEKTDDWHAIIRYMAQQEHADEYILNVRQTVSQPDYRPSASNLATTVIGWTAAGNDATDVDGVNLIEKLSALTIKQDLLQNSEFIWSLLALDSGNYAVPSGASLTREKLIDAILETQVAGGGWNTFHWMDGEWKYPDYTNYPAIDYRPLSQMTEADVDMTSMAIQALAPYRQTNPAVREAIQQALDRIDASKIDNANSLAQLITALCSLGIDPTDFRGRNLLEQLLAYALDGGMFKYNDTSWGSQPNGFATRDAVIALAAYLKSKVPGEKASVYYQMESFFLSDPGSTQPNQPTPPSSGSPAEAYVTVSIIGDSQRGTILDAKRVSLSTGDTPYSVLLKAIDPSRVKVSRKGGSVYVAEIDGLAELDRGPASGWMYSVNGEFPSIAADSFPLKHGDVVEWRYTLDGRNPTGTPQAAPAYNVQSMIQTLNLPVNNTKPVDQINQTVMVQNATERMARKQIEELKQLLRSNSIKIEQFASPNQETILADTRGEVKLFIPGQALTENKSITVQKLMNETRKELLSAIYQFGPKGLRFEKPVEISVKVPLDIEDLQQIAFVWLNEETGQWIPIPAVVDAKTGIVTGLVDHFTQFAVIDRSKLSGAVDVNGAIEAAIRNILSSDTISDWEAFALARAGRDIPASYLAQVTQTLKENNGNFRKVTDYQRMVLGILAAGGDPTKIAGFNLIEKIYNHDRLTAQGTNGLIFGLITLDSRNYPTPATAKWNREKLLSSLLASQNADGGWPLVKGDPSSVDLTAMALVALHPYREQNSVKLAMEKAISWLSGKQEADGGYREYDEQNSESIAQVILGLTTIGIDPTEPRFTKANGNLLTALLSYRQQDGSFAHSKGQTGNEMATEQALSALLAYRNLKEGKGSIYYFVPAKSDADPGPAYQDEQEISPWALVYVKKAREYKIMEGITLEPPRFAPKKTLTRAEFARMVVTLLGEKPLSGQGEKFTDVKPTDWYYGYIAKAKKLGIVKGVTPSAFRPNDPITREQMAIILAHAFQLKPNGQPANMKDIAGLSSLPAIEAVIDNGYMVGYNGQFQPKNHVTREMAATVAVKIHEANQ